MMGFYGGFYFLLWIVMMGVGVGGGIAVVIAIWRGMKAHESMAMSLRILAEKMQDRG